MNPPLRHVSDTALWVAMYRAFESERSDALFRDPYARRLAGERGEAIVRTIRKGRSLAWPMIVRTAVMDEIILRSIGRGVRTVINLAAGLDTRAYRLPVPASLRWFDVDLPDVVAYRREHLGDARSPCLHQDLEADVSDDTALATLLARARDGGPALVVTEGLLVYLTDAQVRALAAAIHRQAEVAWWLLDLATPLMLKVLSRSWQKDLTAAGTPMQFAPAEGTAFFAPLGWREAEFRPTWEESLRLKRSMPLARLWNALMRLRSTRVREAFRRMTAMVLLERVPAGGQEGSS